MQLLIIESISLRMPNQIIENKKHKFMNFNAIALKNNDLLNDGNYVSKKGAVLISKMLNN